MYSANNLASYLWDCDKKLQFTKDTFVCPAEIEAINKTHPFYNWVRSHSQHEVTTTYSNVIISVKQSISCDMCLKMHFIPYNDQGARKIHSDMSGI